MRPCRHATVPHAALTAVFPSCFSSFVFWAVHSYAYRVGRLVRAHRLGDRAGLRAEAAGLLLTVIVQALAGPDMRVEIEAVAASIPLAAKSKSSPR